MFQECLLNQRTVFQMEIIDLPGVLHLTAFFSFGPHLKVVAIQILSVLAHISNIGSFMRTATFILWFAKENLIDRIFSFSTLNVSFHLPPVSFISDKLAVNFIMVPLYMMSCYSIFASKLSHLCLPAVYDVASTWSLMLTLLRIYCVPWICRLKFL